MLAPLLHLVKALFFFLAFDAQYDPDPFFPIRKLENLARKGRREKKWPSCQAGHVHLSPSWKGRSHSANAHRKFNKNTLEEPHEDHAMHSYLVSIS
jgi:hypothetical protein